MSTAVTIATVAAAGTVLVVLYYTLRPTATIEPIAVPPAVAEVGQFVNDAHNVAAPDSFASPPSQVDQLAEFLGSMVAAKGSVLGAAAIVGQTADFANPGVRKTTETLFEQAGLNKELDAFQKRQDGYDATTDKVEDIFVTISNKFLADQKAPPVAQAFGKGMATGLAGVVNAPVEVAALLDSAISAQQARFQGGTDAEKAAVVLGGGRAIVAEVIVSGIGGGLADKLAKTPEERAKAAEVLSLINPNNAVSNLSAQPELKKVADYAKALADKLAAELAAQQKARDAEQKARDAAMAASLKATADRLAKEKADRDAVNKALADKLAAEQKARDAALAASLKATADRLAAEQRARDDKARKEADVRRGKEIADRAAAAKKLAESNAKAKKDLQNIGNSIKNAFTPPKPAPKPAPKKKK